MVSLFNNLPPEVHRMFHELHQLCSNCDIAVEHGGELSKLFYNLERLPPDWDQLSHAFSKDAFRSNRFIRLRTQAPTALQPCMLVPIYTDDEMRIGEIDSSDPGAIVADVHLETRLIHAPRSKPQWRCCLLPLHMFAPYIIRLAARQGTWYPSYISKHKDPYTAVDRAGRIRYRLLIKLHDHGSPTEKQLCKQGLIEALAQLRDESNIVLMPTAQNQADQAMDSAGADAHEWLTAVVQQQEAWLGCSTQTMLKQAGWALGDSALVHCFAEVATASQLLIRATDQLGQWPADYPLRQRLNRQVVAATFNTMSLGRGHPTGRAGWESPLKGDCGERLCICCVWRELGMRGSSFEEVMFDHLRCDPPSGVDAGVWIAVQHVAAFNHSFPADGVTSVIVVQQWLRRLRLVQRRYLDAGLGKSDYIGHDISVLLELEAEMRLWGEEHGLDRLSEFVSSVQHQDEEGLEDTSFRLEMRLSTHGDVKGLPLRLVHVKGEQMWLQGIGGGIGSRLVEADF